MCSTEQALQYCTFLTLVINLFYYSVGTNNKLHTLKKRIKGMRGTPFILMVRSLIVAMNAPVHTSKYNFPTCKKPQFTLSPSFLLVSNLCACISTLVFDPSRLCDSYIKLSMAVEELCQLRKYLKFSTREGDATELRCGKCGVQCFQSLIYARDQSQDILASAAPSFTIIF